ncbi:MAG: sulfatase, partial [Oscillospiraceae bacterium]
METKINKRKNLIYIFADQWRKESMGRYNDDIITPNLDKFAAESFVFERAYTTSPLCSPARACLMSGMYPLKTGVFGNCKPTSKSGLLEDITCITDVLKAQNYDTAYIGKWHLDVPSEGKDPRPNDGAKAWDAFTPPGKRRHGVDFWYSYGTYDNHFNPHYWQDDEKMTVFENTWSVKHETHVAIDYLNNKKNKEKSENPFAMFISFNPPHTPYDMVPEEFLDLYLDKDIKIKQNVESYEIRKSMEYTGRLDETILNTKRYYAAITGIDHYFGEIVKYLKDNNLYDDTLIVVSADHGDMMGSHGRYGKNIWYEEATNIPLICGGSVKPGVSEALIGTPDQTATLLGLLDINNEVNFEGIDFSKLISGENTDDLHETLYVANYPDFSEKFVEKNYNFLDFGYRCLKSQRYSYVCNRREVFDGKSEE